MNEGCGVHGLSFHCNNKKNAVPNEEPRFSCYGAIKSY